MPSFSFAPMFRQYTYMDSNRFNFEPPTREKLLLSMLDLPLALPMSHLLKFEEW